jgi:O-succinylbenzoic acid--CoA ligase
MLSQPLNVHLAKPLFASVSALADGVKAALAHEIALAIAPASEGELQNKYLTALNLDKPTEFEDTAIALCTSGSTGNPKAVEISRDSLIANHEIIKSKLNGTAHWVLAINPAFVGGLTVLSRGILDGGWTYALTETGKFNVDTFSQAALIAAQANPTIRTSLVWAQVIQLVNSEKLETLKMFNAILVGGSKVDTQQFEEIKALGINLISTYGMTESTGGVVWDGYPLAGVELRILESDENGTGTISIKSPTNASGYRNLSELDRETFQAGWVNSQDLGQINSGLLTVIGRVDEVVISGGINVSTAAIEAVIAKCSGVEAVAVIPISDPKWGTIIAAILVGDFNKIEVESSVVKELGAAAKPRVLLAAKDLPILPNGKIDLVKLTEMINLESN